MADVPTSGSRSAAAGAASGAAASSAASGAAASSTSPAARGGGAGDAATTTGATDGNAGAAAAHGARAWLGRTLRGRGERAAGASNGPRPAEPTGRAAAERGRRRAARRADWERIAVFGAGLAVGALLGAGVALLAAPASGFETRARLARGARRARGQVADRFDELADDVRRSAKRGAKVARRKLVRSRWAAEDLIESRAALARRGIARDARA